MSKKLSNKMLRARFNQLIRSDIDGSFKEQYGWEIGLAQTTGLEGFNEWLENEVLK